MISDTSMENVTGKCVQSTGDILNIYINCKYISQYSYFYHLYDTINAALFFFFSLKTH